MYRDFEDLRANCPVELKADVAIDLQHADAGRMAEIWPMTADGEFRLYLTQRVADFWEGLVREQGGNDIPDDGFAIEIVTDSYADADMGHSLFLELHAYCGTDRVGEIAWNILADDDLEARFQREIPPQVVELLAEHGDMSGLAVTAEVAEVAEL